MPQMSPMNWLNMFLFINIIYLMFNIMNFFIINFKINKNMKFYNKILYKNMWKW